MKSKITTVKRIYEVIVLVTWPFVFVACFVGFKLMLALYALSAGGYDYGDHPTERHPYRDFVFVELPLYAAAIAGALILVCIGVWLLAAVLCLFKRDMLLWDAFKKVYKALLYLNFLGIYIALVVMFFAELFN